jgi:hypothetical protein
MMRQKMRRRYDGTIVREPASAFLCDHGTLHA